MPNPTSCPKCGQVGGTCSHGLSDGIVIYVDYDPVEEVCSEGHAMTIHVGPNGRFLACSLYPEHNETRPLPGDEPDLLMLAGVGEPCPTCGESDRGVLAAKRGRFGPFVGCNRYPNCLYVRKDSAPLPGHSR